MIRFYYSMQLICLHLDSLGLQSFRKCSFATDSSHQVWGLPPKRHMSVAIIMVKGERL